MSRYLTAASAATVAFLAVSPAMAQDFCVNYANTIIATNYRGMQRQCPQFANSNMDWDAHFNWCSTQSPDRVRQVGEEFSAKLDGCLTSAAAPQPPRSRVVQPAPPRGPAPLPPGARPPAPGQSFYAKAEGADEPSLCPDISGGQIREGTPIQMWRCHQQAPQRFSADPRRGIIFVTASPNLCVDGADRQQLRLVRCEQASTQWRYDRRTDTIRSANGLCWDIAGGNVPSNIRQRQPVIGYRCHNGINQQFVLNN